MYLFGLKGFLVAELAMLGGAYYFWNNLYYDQGENFFYASHSVRLFEDQGKMHFSFNWIVHMDFLIKILFKLDPESHADDALALVQVMAWCWLGNKPLPESMMYFMVL